MHNILCLIQILTNLLCCFWLIMINPLDRRINFKHYYTVCMSFSLVGYKLHCQTQLSDCNYCPTHTIDFVHRFPIFKFVATEKSA